MSDLPTGDSVDLDAILREGPSDTEAANADGRSNAESGNEGDQHTEGSQWETRLRGLQAAKDREIAAAKQEAQAAYAEAQRAVQLNQAYENMLLQATVQATKEQHGEAAAQQVYNHFMQERQLRALQQQQDALLSERHMLQPAAAEVMAYKLSQDPKYKGVEPAQLMEWAPFGPAAMEKAARALALTARSANVDARKRSGADRMGGGSGGATDVVSTMQGSDLIDFALKNSQRTNRWD